MFVPILQMTRGVGLPVTAGAKASIRAHVPGALLVVISPGQVMVGGVLLVVELTVTMKAHELVLPEASIATQVTIVSPSGKTEPEAGAQLLVTPGQLSLAVGAA